MRKSYFERVPTKEVLAVKKSSLNKAYKKIESDWEKSLKEANVKLPQKDTAKWYQLTTLKHFERNAVHKDDIAALIRKLTGQTATDQQVRHLKTQNGWYILNRGDSEKVGGEELYNPEGCHVLITTQSPLPNSISQRRQAIRGGDWQKILQEYDNACASCGTRIGEYHRFDKSLKITGLEKGHMDPHKPLAPGNLIPQCRWCNRTARADFTFDEQGRPRAVASTRPVSRANDKVIDEIKKWLESKHSPNNKKK